VHGASFYIPRFYMLAISFFPLLLFVRSERGKMYLSVGINLLMLLFFNELLSFFGAGMGLLEPEVEDAFFISVSSVICLLLIGSGFYFLNDLNTRHEQRISELLVETEEKNRRIRAAIGYAQDIQRMILPPRKLEDSLRGEVFVMFRPLDDVSGDFYMLRVEDGVTLFGVIDCTGHGVPGAFVSLLAHSALRRAVRECGARNPGAIVAEANRLFHDDFTRSGNPLLRDGMELVLCSLDRQRGELRISGANLHAFVVSSGKLTAHRCDRGHISPGSPDRVFSEKKIQVDRGDMVYLASDGLSDQFGGPGDRRLGRTAVTAFLTSVANLQLEEQRESLVRFFEEWKGGGFQVDDVCVMGVRV
jgi:sigma-B regulation protein RsbU (phosphoserine phosphatase)